MAKNPYADLNTRQLAEVYFTTKENYGKIEGSLLAEIENRGGETSFLQQVGRENALDTEKARIIAEVAALMSDHPDTSLIKKLVHSDLLSEAELSQFIDRVHASLSAQRLNREIDTGTVTAAILGTLLATAVGGIVCGALLISMGRFYFATLILVYGLSWLCIYLLTKKNASNAMVLIASIVATIAGPLLAFWILGVRFV